MMTSSRLIAAHLRRTSLSLLRPISLLNPTSPPPTPATPYRYRYFSSQQPPPDSVFTHELNSVTESELRNLGFTDGSEVATGGLVDGSVFPVRGLVGLLDGFHDLTGLPWWIVIVSSTVALRVTLLPWVILQLHKLKQIGEAFPKLPPPLPPPFSGKSIIDQLSLFRKERRALGCPSFLWFLGSFTVQLPCFFLWMASVRKMSLDQHPGFDTGGILWFQNLTEVPNGVLGPIFPVLIAGLHFCNIQIGFRNSSIGEGTGLLSFLAKLYQKYLELLTLPLLFVGFYIPQGSLVYWVTNSSLTLTQQLFLQHPSVRQKLGLPDREAVHVAADSNKNVNGSELADSPGKRGPKSAFDLSPRELVDLSVAYFSTGKIDKAVHLLRVAVDKDPECYRAWTLLGQIMLQKGDFEEASEYCEYAVSQISLQEEPSDPEAVDFLIQASVLAGAAYHRQGKSAEAHIHFERVRDMKEPEHPPAKARYYEGLVAFASVLANEGHKDEAVRYLRMAAAYDPEYSVYLKSFISDDGADDFVNDLSSSRRADY